MFCVPKEDPCNPRMILDFKAFTKDTKTPQFQLPNISKVTRTCTKKDYLLKFDLTNGVFILIYTKRPSHNSESIVKINIMPLKISRKV